MTLSFADDYLIFDHPKELLYFSKISPLDHSAGITIPYCQREQEALQSVSADTGLKTRTTFWTLFRTPMDEAGYTGEPKLNDLLEHAGRRYQVNGVEVQDLDDDGPQRYRLACVEVPK